MLIILMMVVGEGDLHHLDSDDQEDVDHLDDGHQSLDLHKGKLNPFQVLLAANNHLLWCFHL